jgi:hypothetical protein
VPFERAAYKHRHPSRIFDPKLAAPDAPIASQDPDHIFREL